LKALKTTQTQKPLKKFQQSLIESGKFLSKTQRKGETAKQIERPLRKTSRKDFKYYMDIL
jgi:hypothetical protein